MKTPVLSCNHDLVRALGTGLGAGFPEGKKVNGVTAPEQVAALTFTVTGKPWAGSECPPPALTLLYPVTAWETTDWTLVSNF